MSDIPSTSTAALPTTIIGSNSQKRFSAKKFSTDLAIGGVAAGVSKTVVAPIERAKILLQIQNASKAIAADRRYRGLFDVLQRVPREQGFLALWRGNWANVIRYFPMQALTFAFRDTYKRIFLAGIDKHSEFWKYAAANVACGGAAGATGVMFIYPLDFVRTRLAADVGRGESREFCGFADCIAKTLRSDGPTGLYRGFFLSVNLVFVYRACYFGIFDTTSMLLSKRGSLWRTGGSNRALPTFLTTYAIAQTSTVLSGILVYPMDTVRRRMMMQSGRLVAADEKRLSSVGHLRRIVRMEGVGALYNGAGVNVLRSVGGALVLTIYEEIQRWMRSCKNTTNVSNR